MPLRASPLLILLAACLNAAPHYEIVGSEEGAWPAIFSSINLTRGTGGIYVLPDPPATQTQQWLDRIEAGAIVVLQGESELAASLGFRPITGAKPVAVRNVVDAREPGMLTVWERTVEIPAFAIPPKAQLFQKEKWKEIPLMAGSKYGSGAVLWLAIGPGEKGHERFPYLLHALRDLGMPRPFRTTALWAFFDSSYRLRADPDYLAARWRTAGIASLHVAAWHYWEPDKERDAYLRKLIEACHRRAITVYAWVELPHVSERFWQDHPEWREKTAVGQDAHLDWRKLMDLNNPDCDRAVAIGLTALVQSFDWDGVNLAELYFESLEGIANASRFTPMSAGIRRDFAAQRGYDPIELFRSNPTHPASEFLNWRADLAHKLQETWIGRIEKLRGDKPDLDLVLTHVDDRYDTRMKDLIGADASKVLPLLDRHNFTFLVEDPATLWNLGPERYTAIAAKYAAITSKPEKLAIDINVVERYQDVYPTKLQTGTELFQLVNKASHGFPRVALYFENSILKQDLDLLPSSAAVVESVEETNGRLAITAKRAFGIPWNGPALVNGKPWPFRDDETLWLPAGSHVVEAASAAIHVRLLDFSGRVETILASTSGFELSYQSDTAAFAVLDKAPRHLELDGAEWTAKTEKLSDRWLLRLPKGQHLLTVLVE